MRLLPDSKIWWNDITDVTEQDVIKLLRIYSNMVTFYKGEFPYTISKSLKKTKLYGECINLYRLLHKFKIKPRLYIQAQFELYFKAKTKDRRFRRKFPTLASMAVPSAVDNYKKYLVDSGQMLPEAVSITQEDLVAYNDSQLKELMKKWNFSDEKDLFADPIMAAQFSLSYLESKKAFQELVKEHFYEDTYRVQDYKELFVC